jgi:hypothetical protein
MRDHVVRADSRSHCAARAFCASGDRGKLTTSSRARPLVSILYVAIDAIPGS